MAAVVTKSSSRNRGVKRLSATFTTHTDGSVAIASIGVAYGKVVAVEYDPGDVATGADITISDSVKSAFLTLTDAGTTPRRVRPTCIPVVAAGTAVTPGAGYDGTKDVYVAGDVYLTVAQGGDTKTGKVNVIVAEIPADGA